MLARPLLRLRRKRHHRTRPRPCPWVDCSHRENSVCPRRKRLERESSRQVQHRRRIPTPVTLHRTQLPRKRKPGINDHGPSWDSTAVCPQPFPRPPTRGERVTWYAPRNYGGNDSRRRPVFVGSVTMSTPSPFDKRRACRIATMLHRS